MGPFASLFASSFSSFFWTPLGEHFGALWRPNGAQRSHFGLIFGTFWCPGGNVKTVISPEREFDLEGSGGSEN